MTKKITFTFAALAALSLSACQHNPEHCDRGWTVPDPTRPRVAIVESSTGPALVIDQDPLVFSPKQADVDIVWSLPRGAGYTFDIERGIRFEEKAKGEIVGCRRSESGLEFTCRNLHQHRGVTYKYDINVVSPDGRRISRDPFVQN
jgi:hypothetical protein